MNAIMSSGMQLLHDYKLVLPADLALLFRVLLRLQGLGRGVGTEVRVTELLEPYVRKMLLERFDPRRIVRGVGRSARSWDHLLGDLPDEIEAILQQVRTGNLDVDFRIHDADQAVDRLVDGVVTAASIMAGAQLISRRSGPTVGGVSVPGLRRRRRRRRDLAAPHRPQGPATHLGHPGAEGRRDGWNQAGNRFAARGISCRGVRYALRR